MSRFRDTMGASPAILVTTAAVALTSMFTGVLGLLPGGTAEGSTAPVLAPQTGAVDSPSTPSARPVPARDVIVELLGADPRWGAVVPVGFGCSTAAPVLSAESGGVSVHVYGPGLGGVVADQVADCGTRTRVNGTDATSITVDTGQVTAWTRGDVLMTLTTPAPAPDVTAALDQRLVAALEGVCPDLGPTTQDATRNPTQGGYTQHMTTAVVTLEPAAGAPDVGPAPAQPPPPEPAKPPMPAGVVGPALPAAVHRPTPPAWPGPQPLQAEVAVPVVDVTGPGCGWAFTGAVAPDVDDAAVRAGAHATILAARTQLEADQTAWVTTAVTYGPALEQYTTDVADWATYTDQVFAITASWAEQAASLAEYQKAVEEYESAVTALAVFLAEQSAAQADYDAAVAACEATGTTPPPDTGAERSVGCDIPPVRPEILDQAPPVVPAKPTPPVLWQPGDPVPGPGASAHP